MASALDLGLLESFSVLLPALLVWVATFMALEKTKILGDNKSMHAIVATVLAFLTIISKGVALVINFIAPWFVLVFIFALLLLLIYMFMGVAPGTIKDYVEKDSPIKWFVFIIGTVIIISGIANVYGQQLLGEEGGNATIPQNTISASERDAASGEYRSNITSTFFHKKVLGLLFIFMLAVFTIALLTRQI